MRLPIRTPAPAVGHPHPDPKLEKGKVIQILQGDLPSPINPPSGCVFRTRCPQAEDRCSKETIQLRRISAQSQSSCLLA
jgi:oligopeptide transport system ATP-binding protein